MGDDDDLGVFELPQHADEPVDVGVVESGVDFVEHAEGAGTRAEDRQEEGDTRHRLLAPGEQGDAARLFAGGAGDDLNGRLEDVDAGLEDDVCLSASENPLEEGAEMTADRLDRLGEEATAVLVDPGDELLDRIFAAARVARAVVPGVAVRDTLKRVTAESFTAAEDDVIADFILGDVGKTSSSGRRVTETVSRTNLYAIQTPQIFDASLLRKAYATVELSGTTDDASVIERMTDGARESVLVVEGDPRNLKITTADDLELVRAIMKVAPPAGRTPRF